MKMLNDTTAQCPECGCPIQKLADGHWGQTKGTLEDALAKHYEIVHPELVKSK